MKFTRRVPLYNYIQTRTGTSTDKDFLYKNCYPEVLLGNNDIQPETTTKYTTKWVVKRPGLLLNSNTTNVAEGRGIYVWTDNNDAVYSVVGDRIYKGTTEITGVGNRLGTTTGKVFFSQTRGGTPRLVVKAGDELWIIDTSDTVTKQTDADILTNLVPGLVYMDGYLFIANKDGTIQHNENPNDAATQISFLSTDVLTAQMFPDQAVGIFRHFNYVGLVKEWSTEFFYNSGGTGTGSILSRAEGTTIQIGCANGNTIWIGDNNVFFIGQSRSGGKFVVMLEGLTPKIVSTQPVEKIINNESDISQARAFGFRIQGHLFYVIQLPGSDKTLVFDAVEKEWWEWSYFNGTTESRSIANDSYPIKKTNKILLIGSSDGKVYEFSPNTYQDNGNQIKLMIRTGRIDFNTAVRKFLYHLELIADRETSASTVSLRWSDDDYQTFSNTKTSSAQKELVWKALGSFSRRSFEITHTDNTPFRAEALEFGFDVGSYAQGNL